eukprot:TRINITY_DN25478_c0_g1_i1.p1 TRINITY_DN25478_c0_g1~~TRINITY_DN25478_c0_g1_i1.p1  ORF type:complete len:273 (+),score=37.22 TRINITY_DN25478_c0_g1_i1:76-819(+)
MGKMCVVHAESSWKVETLKEHIESETEIRQFSQALVVASRTLRNNEVLSDVTELQVPNATITLVQVAPPDCFNDSQASRIWRSFLVFSDDCGESTYVSSLRSVMRYSGMIAAKNELANYIGDYRGRVTFHECLDVIAKWKDARHKLDDVDLREDKIFRACAAHDPEGVGLLPLPVVAGALRTVLRLGNISEEDIVEHMRLKDYVNEEAGGEETMRWKHFAKELFCIMEDIVVDEIELMHRRMAQQQA